MRSKEAHAAYMRAWYQKNKEKVKGWSRRWADANPEKVRELSRVRMAAWVKSNPEKAKGTRDRAKNQVREMKQAAKAGGCADCGDRTPSKLILHHVDQATKLFNLGTGAGTLYTRFGLEKVAAEIAKCVCLCRLCHHKRHGFKTGNGLNLVQKLRRDAKNKGCADCGERDHAKLHFHHTDPSTKLFPVSRGTALQATRDELAKCECLCTNCHKKRHGHQRR